MEDTQVRLGSTGIVVNKNGFGALPIQRVSDDAAVFLLKKLRAIFSDAYPMLIFGFAPRR